MLLVTETQTISQKIGIFIKGLCILRNLTFTRYAHVIETETATVNWLNLY